MAEIGSCEGEKPPEDADLEAEEGENEVGKLRCVEMLSRDEVLAAQSEALTAVVTVDGGMIENSAPEFHGGSELKTQVPKQEVVPNLMTEYDVVRTENQLLVSESSPARPEGYLLEQKVIETSTTEANLRDSPDPKWVNVIPNLKTPVSDGYNWRKYGQKQVKSPTGSRSYYKCTYSACCAKKIECSDQTGHVIEIVNKGMHSHDPPRKNNCVREKRVVSSAGPGSGISDVEPSTSPKELNQETNDVLERKRQYSSGSDKNGEEHTGESEPKKRVKKDDVVSPGSIDKPVKKPKVVVHAAGDVGISSDGYRWRKYGQKMVKGNSHPRNYYRCTSAGCPVRKHIETAVDNSDAVIITYKGSHDHDMPVPKKRHGPPSAPLIAATTPATMNTNKTNTTQNQITSSTQWSVSTAGELTGEARDLGSDKAIESARTLLSIGFEIKPC